MILDSSKLAILKEFFKGLKHILKPLLTDAYTRVFNNCSQFESSVFSLIQFKDEHNTAIFLVVFYCVLNDIKQNQIVNVPVGLQLEILEPRRSRDIVLDADLEA